MERINGVVTLCVRYEASCPSGFWHVTFISLLQDSIYRAPLPISSTTPQGVLPCLYGPLWRRGGVSITLLWDETPAWAESPVRSPGARGWALFTNTEMLLSWYKQLIYSRREQGQSLSGCTVSYGVKLCRTSLSSHRNRPSSSRLAAWGQQLKHRHLRDEATGQWY